VSRSILRESVKVLAAKGLVEVRPKSGVRARPRSDWNLLDPHVLAWQGEAGMSAPFIRNLCEIRRIIEPAAAELAAIRASAVRKPNAFSAAELEFHSALFAACNNDLFEQMNATIGKALRACRDIAVQLRRSTVAALPFYKQVVAAIRNRCAPTAHAAMEQAVNRAAGDIFRLLRIKNNPPRSK
jgi:DNA-binding FadR family transcriptional regulator